MYIQDNSTHMTCAQQIILLNDDKNFTCNNVNLLIMFIYFWNLNYSRNNK